MLAADAQNRQPSEQAPVLNFFWCGLVGGEGRDDHCLFSLKCSKFDRRGLGFSNTESLAYAIENRVGTYYSRSRDGLWVKGETSGATQQLLGIRFDCDRDCLQFRVTQSAPGFCHRNSYTCFGEYRSIQTVMQRLVERINDADPKSFTRKLAGDAAMLETKLLEEAKELSDASQADDDYEIAWEAADVLYFSLVAMLKNGVTLDRVYDELSRRMNRVVRRKNKLENQ